MSTINRPQNIIRAYLAPPTYCNEGCHVSRLLILLVGFLFGILLARGIVALPLALVVI